MPAIRERRPQELRALDATGDHLRRKDLQVICGSKWGSARAGICNSPRCPCRFAVVEMHSSVATVRIAWRSHCPAKCMGFRALGLRPGCSSVCWFLHIRRRRQASGADSMIRRPFVMSSAAKRLYKIHVSILLVCICQRLHTETGFCCDFCF